MTVNISKIGAKIYYLKKENTLLDKRTNNNTYNYHSPNTCNIIGCFYKKNSEWTFNLNHLAWEQLKTPKPSSKIKLTGFLRTLLFKKKTEAKQQRTALTPSLKFKNQESIENEKSSKTL